MTKGVFGLEGVGEWKVEGEWEWKCEESVRKLRLFGLGYVSVDV